MRRRTWRRSAALLAPPVVLAVAACADRDDDGAGGPPVVPAPPVQPTILGHEDTGIADLTGRVIETAGSEFVASFSPRSRVRPGEAIEVGVDTRRRYAFDLETGLAIR